MNPEKLKKILNLHKLWVDSKSRKGERAKAIHSGK